MNIQPVNAPKVPEDFHIKLRKRFHQTLVKDVAPYDPQFSESISLFKGIPAIPKNYEDTDHMVEQESTFWYLFGVKETDCYAIIHNQSGKSVLFFPKLDDDYKLWMVVKSIQELKAIYPVDHIHYVSQLEDYIAKCKPKVYLYSGVDSDSGIAVAEPEAKYFSNCQVNRDVLWPLISNLRVIKTAQQMELIRYVCRLTTEAHIVTMKSAKVGLKQVQMHTVFHFHHSIKSGSTQMGFASICSSGQDCATLHYIENDKVIQPGQMLLHDIGGKWYGYVADQAICFPISGKFDPKQTKVYNAVYFAQKAVLDVLKPGVHWADMHLLAEKVILEHLIQMGVVNNYSLEQLIEKRVGAIFFPHGVGHFFGLKVHDNGGYTKGPERSKKDGLKKLRTQRVMEEGMCITVEPGLYFIDFLIQKSLKDENVSKYLNKEKIDEYREVGGVRLEDDVLITKDGIEMLSFLPRTIEDVEGVLQNK